MSPTSASESDSAKCPQCGAPVSKESAQGLCPKCLFAEIANATDDAATTRDPLPPPTPAEIASHFPQLEILECLGRGGMGVVYRARQKSLDRIVALKLLAPERVNDPAFSERFSQEALALAKLSHPNIVTIHDFGQAGGFFFLLMEFVDGVNLRQAMKAGRFTPEQALAIVPPVCEALQYAHERGIVHRDIKPENLLLDKDGRVKIADFGVAKIIGRDPDNPVREGVQTGAPESLAAGTPQYMAPEQKDHRVTDHRADIYSLGVVLYELLTGELPGAKLQPPSQRVQVDVRIDEIVLRALQNAPELRFATATEFRTQVETLRTPQRSSVPPAATNSEPTRRRRNGLVAIGAAAIFIVLALISTAFTKSSGGQPEAVIAVAFVIIAAYAFRDRILPRRVPTSIVLASLLCILAIVIPLVAGRMHGAELQAATAAHTVKIRQLQSEIMSVNARIGNANAIAGRAASRAGNSAERDETRAQAREEQADHEQRSAKLREELSELLKRFAAESARPPDMKEWRVTLIMLMSVALAAIGVPLLLKEIGALRAKAEPNGPHPLPAPAADSTRLIGVQFVATALTIVWWFGAFPVVAYCADAIRRPDTMFIAIIAMGTLLPIFGVAANRMAGRWVGTVHGSRCLRAFSVVGWLLSIPALGVAAFFFHSALSESGGWHPRASEAILVPLICFGAVLLPFAATLLWQAQRGDHRARSKIFATLVATFVSLAAFAGGMMANQRARFSGGLLDIQLQPVRVVGNGLIVRLVTGEKCPPFELRPFLEGAELPAGQSFSKELIVAMHEEKHGGAYVVSRSRSVNLNYYPLGSRFTVPIAFVLPTPELAQRAFQSLRALGPFELTQEHPRRAVIFEIDDPVAGPFVGALRFTTPVEKGNPRWAQIRNLPPVETPNSFERAWEFQSSRAAAIRLSLRDSAGSSEAIGLTEEVRGERLHRQTARLRLYKVSESRLGLRITIGTQSSGAEFDGDFAALAEEMGRMMWTEKLKTERDWDIELCRLAGNPVLVRIFDPLDMRASFARHEVATILEPKNLENEDASKPLAKAAALFTTEGRHALNREHHLTILPPDPKTGNPPQRGYEIGFKSFPARLFSQLARGDEPFVACWDESTKRLWLGSPSALIWHGLAFEGDESGQHFQDVNEIPPDIANDLPPRFREVVAKWYPKPKPSPNPDPIPRQ